MAKLLEDHDYKNCGRVLKPGMTRTEIKTELAKYRKGSSILILGLDIHHLMQNIVPILDDLGYKSIIAKIV